MLNLIKSYSATVNTYARHPDMIFRLANHDPCLLRSTGLLAASLAFVTISIVAICVAIYITASQVLDENNAFLLSRSLALYFSVVLGIEVSLIKPLFIASLIQAAAANIMQLQITFRQLFRFAICFQAIAVIYVVPFALLLALLLVALPTVNPEMASRILIPLAILAIIANMLIFSIMVKIYHDNFRRSWSSATAATIGLALSATLFIPCLLGIHYIIFMAWGLGE